MAILLPCLPLSMSLVHVPSLAQHLVLLSFTSRGEAASTSRYLQPLFGAPSALWECPLIPTRASLPLHLLGPALLGRVPSIVVEKRHYVAYIS
jgi:hypothetical protein